MNWVFLGDSLTEGVGSKRISYVTQLVTQMRSAQREMRVHEMRLRSVDPRSFNPDIEVNVAGKMDLDPAQSTSDLWLWNLACEGQTIESDFAWLPLITTLRPELVVIFRGSLESIIRPASFHNGAWPWWVPASWRGYAAMDPRCYFSTTWWRKAKQQTLDTTRQKTRLKMLACAAGKPLMDQDAFTDHLTTLVRRLRELNTRVLLLGLLSVDEERFPGSPAHFEAVNAKLRDIANAEGVEFFDWAAQLKGARNSLFYRDGFHPNLEGANALAEALRTRLVNQ
ncbi:MAG TPA: SGNH/GDSL hydrolase family protein [Pyrinomonadaceae bacterium]|nr:SGNH/GDSL hydrolase family protein [Pyrinomonadaceae bacterium]